MKRPRKVLTLSLSNRDVGVLKDLHQHALMAVNYKTGRIMDIHGRCNVMGRGAGPGGWD